MKGEIIMLHKVGTQKQLETIKDRLPTDVYNEALRNADILDSEYGADRDVDKDLGGYLLICETANDVADIDKTHFDMSDTIAEHVEVIQGYAVALFILSSDYAIVVIMPQEHATANIKNAINRRD